MSPPTIPAAGAVEHRTRGIVAFLVIAFGLAWLPFLPALFGSSAPGSIFMPFAPAIACFIVRKWVTREGFGDSGLRPGFRYWRLYLLAVAWPFAATLVYVPLALALGVAPDGFAVPWGLGDPSLVALLSWPLIAFALAPIIFGEEFGWRGYLQIRLFADQPLRAALATGVIWGVWHYPMILAGGQNTADRLQTLLIFPVATTTMSVFLGWLRLRTGSVWPGSVAHASNNATENNLSRLTFTGDSSGTLPASATWPILLAEALVLLGIVAVDHLRRQPRRTALAPDAPVLDQV